MNETESMEFLNRIAADPNNIYILAVPVLLLLVIFAGFVAISRFIASQERDELEEAMVLPDSPDDAPDDVPDDTKATQDAAPDLSAAPASTSVDRAGATASAPADVVEILNLDSSSWLSRLRGGLSKTRERFSASVGSLFAAGVKIDDDVLEQLHEALYRADIGVQTADKLVEHVRNNLDKNESADWDAVAMSLKEHASELLAKPDRPLTTPNEGPWVILVCGVNGVGKTTSIGKLAAHFLANDKSVLLCAADTFRVAAIDQLKVWGDRLGVDVIAHQAGSDPAAVAYDGVKAAASRGVDVLLIDTAGRLHNKTELMDELGKIKRVIGRDLPDAPHETWLVIDATTGQNAVMQVKAFADVVDLSGLIVTKLDGTAKGGVLIGVSDQFALPIRYVGVGEKAADLQAFSAKDYVESLF